MENVERKILIPEEFSRLTEDEQEPISNEMFQYLWGWKNKKHDKPISVNGEVYWIIQSPPPNLINRNTYHFCNEEQVVVRNDIFYYQRPSTRRTIGVVGFHLHKGYKMEMDFQDISNQICCVWSKYSVENANQEVEDWKVRRREIFIEHYGVDTPYQDPYVKEVA